MKGQHEQQCIALDEIKQGRLAKIAGLGADNEQAARYAVYVHDRGCNCAHGMFGQVIREPMLFVAIHNSVLAAYRSDESGGDSAPRNPPRCSTCSLHGGVPSARRSRRQRTVFP